MYILAEAALEIIPEKSLGEFISTKEIDIDTLVRKIFQGSLLPEDIAQTHIQTQPQPKQNISQTLCQPLAKSPEVSSPKHISVEPK